jgi:hypothetical protein
MTLPSGNTATNSLVATNPLLIMAEVNLDECSNSADERLTVHHKAVLLFHPLSSYSRAGSVYIDCCHVHNLLSAIGLQQHEVAQTYVHFPRKLGLLPRPCLLPLLLLCTCALTTTEPRSYPDVTHLCRAPAMDLCGIIC